jgi:hypothetical protein
VIERFAPAFWARFHHQISLDQRKALQAILQCRTPALGGHRYACSCGHQHHAFHSCQHRLCPRCGKAATREWVGKQLTRLLPVSYYMVTFTLPATLHGLVHHNRKALELFMQCSGDAIAQLLADPAHGGFHRCGFFGVYQSWTQDMRLHPHVHYIVPAVGIDSRGTIKRPRKPGFLIYAAVLAKRLRTLLSQSLLDAEIIDSALFWKLVKMDWNASVDRAGSGENAVKYLGQYVHRSVISDQRILKVEHDHVHIRTRDRQTGQAKTCVMEGVEFVRRFLQHALPSGFHRIRYRGFLHARRGRIWTGFASSFLSALTANSPPSRKQTHPRQPVHVAEGPCNRFSECHGPLPCAAIKTSFIASAHEQHPQTGKISSTPPIQKDRSTLGLC